MQDTSKGKMAQSQIQEGMTLPCTWRQMACLDPDRGPGTCSKWNWTSRNKLNVPCESLPQVSSKFKAVGTVLVHNVCPPALTLEIALSTWNPGPHYAVPGLSAREEKSHWSAWGRPLPSRVQCPDGGWVPGPLLIPLLAISLPECERLPTFPQRFLCCKVLRPYLQCGS